MDSWQDDTSGAVQASAQQPHLEAPVLQGNFTLWIWIVQKALLEENSTYNYKHF